MSKRSLTPFGSVCRICHHPVRSTHSIQRYASIVRRPSLQDQLARDSNHPLKQRKELKKQILTNTEHASGDNESRSTSSVFAPFLSSDEVKSRPESLEPTPEMIANPKAALRKIQESVLQILDSHKIPAETELVEILQMSQRLATLLAHPERYAQANTIDAVSREVSSQQIEAGQTRTDRAKPRSTLLVDLDTSQDRSPSNRSSTDLSEHSIRQAPCQNQSDISTLLQTLYTLLESPQVYISEAVLTPYVHTCTVLSSPNYLPKIFRLYADKPIPISVGTTIKYHPARPRHPSSAIPPSLVHLSLESALKAKDLPLCFALIDTTVCTPAYRTARFIRRGFIPLGGFSLLIPLAHTAAMQASEWQVTTEPSTFYWMAMSGTAAYLGTMGTLLYVSMTTWNDDHKRVRWVPGTPFSKRWLGEEERYWFDRVAQTWGFDDVNRHGEEESEEWEVLREECARRWMELDRSSLLPGML